MQIAERAEGDENDAHEGNAEVNCGLADVNHEELSRGAAAADLKPRKEWPQKGAKGRKKIRTRSARLVAFVAAELLGKFPVAREDSTERQCTQAQKKRPFFATFCASLWPNGSSRITRHAIARDGQAGRL
jgi:hypothetical protein